MSDSTEFRNEVNAIGPARAATPFRISESVVPYLLSTIDLSIIFLSSVVAGGSYDWLLSHELPNLLPYCAIGILSGLLYILRMGGKGHYNFTEAIRPRLEISRIASCWFITALLLALLAFLLKIGPSYSRGALVAFSMLAPLLLFAGRSLAKTFLAAAVSNKVIGWRPIVVIGVPREFAALREQSLLTEFSTGDVKTFMLRDGDATSASSVDATILNSAAAFARRHDCREILLALPWADTKRLDFVRNHISATPTAAWLLPDANVRALTRGAAPECLRALAINVQSAPLSEAQCLMKRSVDIALAVVALLFFSPIIAITAIAIKLDTPGPIIFRQDRKGFNGRRFTIFKFRSMTSQENGPTVSQATRGDPRVTEIGRILRATSVDELPQLFNVLRGEMSLVGPRPHALAHDDQFEQMLSNYAVRQHVKPGITGWAQCNGARGATPSLDHIAERVRLDLWYINNWSMKLDVKILVRTLFEVMKQRNAY